jgi:2-hydroxychromene-2-carboxylate isomerase
VRTDQAQPVIAGAVSPAAARAARRARRPPKTPRFYFSLRSPYSWLAYRDLRRDHPDVLARLEWAPFWEPDEISSAALSAAGAVFPYTSMSRAKHLYVLLDVRRLATERGLAVTWPVDRDPCWEVPHLAYLAAARHGRGPAFVEAAYDARWQRGLDICAPATMAELAIELELPVEELRDAASDPALRAAGVDALLAVCRDGVFGVPFFVHGYDKYWGIDRLRPFIDSVNAERAIVEADRGTPSPVARTRIATARAGAGAVAGPVAVAVAARGRPDDSPVATAVVRTADDGHAGGCG